jgi:hypothetical protein
VFGLTGATGDTLFRFSTVTMFGDYGAFDFEVSRCLSALWFASVWLTQVSSALVGPNGPGEGEVLNQLQFQVGMSRAKWHEICCALWHRLPRWRRKLQRARYFLH